MLNSLCKLLRGLSSADGHECVLNFVAFEGLIDLVRDVYGDHAADVLDAQFSRRKDGTIVCWHEEVELAFLTCLTGVG